MISSSAAIRDRLLKITDLYQQNQEYRLQRLRKITLGLQAKRTRYSHVADPSKLTPIINDHVGKNLYVGGKWETMREMAYSNKSTNLQHLYM